MLPISKRFVCVLLKVSFCSAVSVSNAEGDLQDGSCFETPIREKVSDPVLTKEMETEKDGSECWLVLFYFPSPRDIRGHPWLKEWDLRGEK